MPSLKMLRGPEPGRIYELASETITIGRGRKNDIIIHDNEISREHCRLVRVLFDYELSDLNSTNGTFLNGRPVSEASSALFDKNIIELGDSIVLEYMASRETTTSLDPEPEATPEAPPGVQTPLPAGAENSSPGNFYLVIRRRSQLMPEVYLLDSPLVDIGRHLDNAICLTENQVSRFHLRLNRLDEGYVLEDLGSMNGTWVNSVRVETNQRLKPGDYVTIGHMVEMWYTNNLETLRMIPHTAQQAAAARKITEEFRKDADGQLTARPTSAAPEPATPQPRPAPAAGTSLLDPARLELLDDVPAPSATALPPPDAAHDATVSAPDGPPPPSEAAPAIAGLLARAAAAISPQPPSADETAAVPPAAADKPASPAPSVDAAPPASPMPELASDAVQQVAALVRQTKETPALAQPPEAPPASQTPSPDEAER